MSLLTRAFQHLRNGTLTARLAERLGVSGADGSPAGDFAPVAELTVESKAFR